MANGDSDLFRDLAAEAAIVAEAMPTEGNTARLVKMATKYVELEARKKQLDADLKAVNVELWDLRHKHLVDLMNEIGTDHIGVPDANADVVLLPYYKANIAAEWTDEAKAAAYAHLEELGLGDILKNTITVVFPKGWDEERAEWLEKVRGLNLSFDPPEMIEAKSVPWNTLTATVKEQVNAGKHLNEDGTPRMKFDLIGAVVGHEVTLKARK
jgi:hypothetical protein